MLKSIQKKKLSHFFNVLDYKKNGHLREDDFTGIGENTCFYLSIPHSSKDYDNIIERSKDLYKQLIKGLNKTYGDTITMDEWLNYFDHEIIAVRNVSLLQEYVQITVKYIFDLYDQNHDNLLSVEEYADMFSIYGIDITYSAKSFLQLDKNHDYGISKQELTNAVKEFFVSPNPEAGGNWIFGNWEV
jgi:Ca2+-binding EF-hand superfamily protein